MTGLRVAGACDPGVARASGGQTPSCARHYPCEVAPPGSTPSLRLMADETRLQPAPNDGDSPATGE
jgi:hypothetical protein